MGFLAIFILALIGGTFLAIGFAVLCYLYDAVKATYGYIKQKRDK